MTDDERHMSRALALAEAGRGAVEPNPLVGAVVVAGGAVVGEGWHRAHGGPHAEVFALAAAGERARGSTLYVSLEPCCHHGKTPPCTDAVLASGVRRVVVAMHDPFPKVAGGGLCILREAGLDVTVGVLEAAARRQNAPYLKLLATGLPWVHAKWAMTLDGCTAARTGDSKWISGEPAREAVHALRGRMDAILVGRGTVMADDPQLTARPPGPRTPTRIVVSASGELPSDCVLTRTANAVPVLLFAGRDVPAWREAGAEVIADSRLSVTGILEELGRRRMTNLLLEGGAGVFGSFADAIDELHVFVAPKFLGGGHPATAGAGVARIADASRFTLTATTCGDDVYLHGVRE